jgi:hypothetical protein
MNAGKRVIEHGVGSFTFAILGSRHPGEWRDRYELSTTVLFTMLHPAETSGKRSLSTMVIVNFSWIRSLTSTNGFTGSAMLSA